MNKSIKLLFGFLCAVAVSISVGAAAVQAVGNGTISLPLSVANGGTGTAAPAPSVTATACGATISQTSSFPSQLVHVPSCPAVSATTGANVNNGVVGATGYIQYVQNPIAITTTQPASTPAAMATPSITLGTSNGPVGAWRVITTLAVSANATGAAVSFCIAGTNAGTNATHTYYTSGASNLTNICSSAPPLNPLAGTPSGGGSTTTSIPAIYSAQYANGTTINYTCYEIAGASPPNTLGGYCDIIAYPI